MNKNCNKIDIARIQIDKACEIHMSRNDYFSSLTLAGAAEGILGPIVVLEGGQSSLARAKKSIMAFSTIDLITQEKRIPKPGEEKLIGDKLNEARNAIKHFGSDIEKDLFVTLDPFEESRQMIYRVIENYFYLFNTYTESMLKFLNSGEMTRQSESFEIPNNEQQQQKEKGQ